MNRQVSFLASYCNFYSFFGIFPYKIETYQFSKRFEVSTSKLRKIICIIFVIVALCGSLTYSYGIYFIAASEWKDPTPMFVITNNLMCNIGYYCFLEIIWRKSDKILEIANEELHSSLVSPPIYQIGLLCLSPLILVGINNPLQFPTEYVGISGPLKLEKVLQSFSGKSHKNQTGPSIALEGFEYLQYFITFYSHLYFLAGTGFLVALILSMRSSLNGVANKVLEFWCKTIPQMETEKFIVQVVTAELKMKETTQTANAIIGRRMIAEYLLLLAFYANIFDFFINSNGQSTQQQVHIILYLIFSASFWLIACEIHYQAKNITNEWVQGLRSNLIYKSPDSLKIYDNTLLGLELKNCLNPVGISCRCFTVTYQFLGSMSGLIITYSTIVYQMRMTKE